MNLHFGKYNQAPKRKRYHGIHPIRHNKDRARRVANKVHNDTLHYKELGRQDAKWRANPNQQTFYDDKSVTQYAVQHMTPTKKIVVVLVIVIVLALMVVAMVQ